MLKIFGRSLAIMLSAPLFGLLFIVAALSGIGGVHHDKESRNVHLWQRSSDGMLLEGHNANSGKSWKTFIGADGVRNGYDANGHHWTYDSRNGEYHNPEAGRHCIGFGEARRCAETAAEVLPP